MTLAGAHRLVGVLTLGAFIASGVYLRVALPAADGENTWLHYAFRANHIYLLLAGLVNLALGFYIGVAKRPVAQRLGSALVMAAPVLLAIAFVVEPGTGDLSRPLTRIGVVLITLGCLAHAAAGPVRIGR